MAHRPFTPADLDTLRQWDTPTVCNGLELIVPGRRAVGYTVEPMVVADRTLPPIVGLARTGLIRAKEGPRSAVPPREDWYDYVAADGFPTVALIQDIDDRPGYGAFWGEVQSNVHKALGCLGVITNGSVRDIPMIASGFQMLAGSIVPSHAYVHVVDFGIDVAVHGMAVKSGDLIHADRHGAIVVPPEKIAAMRAALDGLSAREAKIIAAARAGGDLAAIKAAMTG